jgi:hypothetical protein
VVDVQPTAEFLPYVRRRQAKMVGGSAVAVVVGIAVILAYHKVVTLNIVMGGVIVVGILLALGTMSGRRLLREIDKSLAGPARTMELQTYGYRSIKAVTNNRVLATLDDVGSTNRTPKVEFRAIWFTPGLAEAPGGTARVFGVEAVGEAVLAIANNGGVLGRVKRVHPR